MTIYRVPKGDIEHFSVLANPSRTFSSSSTGGVTGSVYVFARRSPVEKDLAESPAIIDSRLDDSSIKNALRLAQMGGRVARLVDDSDLDGQFPAMVNMYLNAVNAASSSAKLDRKIDVQRWVPPVQFGRDTLKKLYVKDVLSRDHRVSYPSAHWAYTNYNCLSFYTSSTVPTSSVLLYPNVGGGPVHTGYVSGVYSLSGAFSFDFYLNPRFRSPIESVAFHAGTIFHLSSCYALSLVSGSRKDENGLVSGFRIKLQLSHSADQLPSVSTPGNKPNDLTFLSDDNALSYNHWHHVIVRWGTSVVNDGTGSFNIDGNDRGTFVVPSGTVSPATFVAASGSGPDVLCVGNFFEGRNFSTGSLARFFAADPAQRDGLEELEPETGIESPNEFAAVYGFRHPLNADVHDLSIKRYYMSNTDIATSASVGPKTIDSGSVAFYLPPFFVSTSSLRRAVAGYGGVPQTPFFAIDGTTDDPFNVAMSFGVNGHYINIENFLRDFANDTVPRTHHMTATLLDETAASTTANEFLYGQAYVRRRNTLIMPCDDGLFVPSFQLLVSESARQSYVDDLGVKEMSFVHLDDLVLTASLLLGSTYDLDEDATDAHASDFLNELVGFTPENPGTAAGTAVLNHSRSVANSLNAGSFDAGVQMGAPLTIFQRTRDPSSNQITFFDISNIFYGKRIKPGSVVLRDSSLSGSGGVLDITLRDDGRGTMYRADCLTSASTWNSCGTCYYDEGLIVLKSPHLFFFGKEQYELSFRGEQGVHVLRVEAIAPANQLNSSSSPNFVRLSPSGRLLDDDEHVVISQILYMDENYNVVMRSQLAQPLVKRTNERFLFRSKIDF